MRTLIFAALCCVTFAACSSVNGGSFIGLNAGAVQLTESALTFTATGAAYAQTTAASQAHYGGVFTASSTTCSGIATISLSTGSTFTITPVAPGSCTFTIAGGSGETATLAVTVTTTTVGGS